jgi:uncharacterized protein YkwD
MTTAQKIGVAFTLILVVTYFAFVSYRDGGLDSLGQRFSGMPSMIPVDSVQPDASPSPEVSGAPTMVVSVVPSVVSSASMSPLPVSQQGALLAAMNARRTEAGAERLLTHPILAALAQAHADDMASKGYFSHVSPSGVTFEQRISSSGYTGTSNAENLGLTSNDALEIVSGWMGSEGHRVNLLNTAYVSVGIGVSRGMWQGMPVTFVAAVFGSEK